MVTDISSNNANSKRVVLTSGKVISSANHARLRNTESMINYLVKNGYKQEQAERLSKNDLIFACRTKMGLLG